MPRGKRNVYIMSCGNFRKDSAKYANRTSEADDRCNLRVGTVRLHNQKDGKSWKEFSVEKYCADCRKRTPMRLKQERHSK